MLNYRQIIQWGVSVILFTGCQSQTASPPLSISTFGQSLPTQNRLPSVDLNKEIVVTRPWRIGIVLKQKPSESKYWHTFKTEAIAIAQELGIEIQVLAPEQSCQRKDTNEAEIINNHQDLIDHNCVESQILAVIAMSQQDLDGMILATVDSNRLVPVVEQAIAPNVPVVVVDTPLNSPEILTTVVFDNFRAGQAIGTWVVEQLQGQGKALIINGPVNQVNAIQRRDGMLAGLQTGNIQVLDIQSATWSSDVAREITAQWLDEFEQIDVILAANDEMALGALEAVAAADRQILVTGFDGIEPAIEAIETNQLAATVKQSSALMARISIKLLLRHLETGEKFPPTVLIHPEEIISGNAQPVY